MTDQAAEGLLSPMLRNRRIQAAKPFLRGRVLDVGCGNGALAEYVTPETYTGVEVDETSLAACARNQPAHRFSATLPAPTERFDTIVSLAVIEHVGKPLDFLLQLTQRLSESNEARIVLSTPHPAMDWIHTAGAKLGFFSRHASDEHEELLDRHALQALGSQANLQLSEYHRFMLGANQLAVYQRKPST
jgi:2-polyprenyl-3-methyl-5-hydroxy-6-metoxy-1,4-benzoquinol methylase